MLERRCLPLCSFFDERHEVLTFSVPLDASISSNSFCFLFMIVMWLVLVHDSRALCNTYVVPIYSRYSSTLFSFCLPVFEIQCDHLHPSTSPALEPCNAALY